MRQVKAYHCDYCRRIMANKKNMENHEKICLRRPESRACYTCGNMEWATARNNEHVSVLTCRLGQMKPDPNNKRNPLGLVRDCEHWISRHPGEAE